MSVINLPTSCEELLGRMVSINTVNTRYGGPGENELALVLEQLGGAWGLVTRRFPLPDGRFNLLIAHEPAPGGHWILGESHLDTVSVAGMNVPAHQLTSAGSRLHGRGTCDTKGSGAAMLWALLTAVRQGSADRNLGVLFTIDEEAGMTGARELAAAALRRWPGPIDGIIVGEPTDLRPVIAHNGVVRWTTVTHGRAAHSADPSRGQSAISLMVRVVDELESRYVPVVATRTHPLTGGAACSINVIRGGTQVNIVPERCEIEVDRRLAPGESAESALAERDRVLAGLTSHHPGRIEHQAPYYVPALPAEPNEGLLSTLAPLLAAQGLDPAPAGARYVTNASFYAAAGIPSVVLGPGSIAQAHTADEWLDRNQLELATRLYAEVFAARKP